MTFFQTFCDAVQKMSDVFNAATLLVGVCANKRDSAANVKNRREIICNF